MPNLFSIALKLQAAAKKLWAVATYVADHPEEVAEAIVKTVAVVGVALAGAAAVLLKVVAARAAAAAPTLIALA